jgi:hypothetical protein
MLVSEDTVGVQLIPPCGGELVNLLVPDGLHEMSSELAFARCGAGEAGCPRLIWRKNSGLTERLC